MTLLLDKNEILVQIIDIFLNQLQLPYPSGKLKDY